MCNSWLCDDLNISTQPACIGAVSMFREPSGTGEAVLHSRSLSDLKLVSDAHARDVAVLRFIIARASCALVAGAECYGPNEGAHVNAW